MLGNSTGDTYIFADKLTILSANARGLRQPLKRMDYWKKLSELHCNIAFLQETHLIEKDMNVLKKEWNVDFFYQEIAPIAKVWL